MYSSFLCSYWTSSFLSVSKLTHCVASDASVGSTKYSAAISQCTCNWNCGKTSNEARFSTMKTNLLSEQPLSDAECIIKTVLHSFRNPLVTRKKNRTTLQQGLCVKIHGCNMSVKHAHTSTTPTLTHITDEDVKDVDILVIYVKRKRKEKSQCSSGNQNFDKTIRRA